VEERENDVECWEVKKWMFKQKMLFNHCRWLRMLDNDVLLIFYFAIKYFFTNESLVVERKEHQFYQINPILQILTFFL
jgi:hypothetical protein